MTPHRDIPPIITTTATALSAEAIVTIAIFMMVVFYNGTIAAFLNRLF